MHAVAFSTKRAHLRNIEVLKGCVRRFGLTPARYDMLYAIWKNRATWQADLWRLFDVSRTTVSRMLAALERLGLIHRSPGSGRHSRMLHLTEKGKTLMREAFRGCHRPLCLLFESFYPEVRSRLDRAIQVEDLQGTIALLAVWLGNRSTFSYPYNAPEDVYPFVPDPTETLYPVLTAGR